MGKSIGIIEFRSIAIGISAVDKIIKASEVNILDAKTLCPGKYFIIFTGEVAAVRSSMSVVRQEEQDFIIDSGIMPNVYPELFAAYTGTSEVKELKAIGIIETLTSPSIFKAADDSVKATSVDLIEVRVARALGGKNICILNGDVASVKESVRAGIDYPERKGFLVESRVIPSPHRDLYGTIL